MRKGGACIEADQGFREGICGRYAVRYRRQHPVRRRRLHIRQRGLVRTGRRHGRGAAFEPVSYTHLSRTDENLILYTCYPFDSLGYTPFRFFVYADYVSGPALTIAQQGGTS